MSIIVQKFGGTSLATVKHIQEVAKKISVTKKSGKDVVIVVSAMANETDRLLALVNQISTNLFSPERDLVASTGEGITCALLSLALQSLGHKSRSFLSHELPIMTDSKVSDAEIHFVDPDRILHSLNNDEIPVIAGFQGISPEGRVTTLGRGGSDTTAVAVAAALGGVSCEIYTDVEGVFSVDPKVTKQARLLPQVSYSFMIEAARLGAKVMHDKSVEIGQKHHVPIEVKSTFIDKPGSIISDNENQERLVAISLNQEDPKFSQVSLIVNILI